MESKLGHYRILAALGGNRRSLLAENLGQLVQLDLNMTIPDRKHSDFRP
jgi:hypothetical protein